jgi:type IV pilus assembly protein PilC
MPKFKFTAKKIGSSDFSGEKEAADRFDLARQLKQDGYVLFDFHEEGAKKKYSLNFFENILGTVSLSEKMIFTRNLGVMLGAGLPLTRALEVLNRQTKNPKFKKVISNISLSLSKGRSLSESISDHRSVFPPIFSSMVKAGEQSGKMEEALGIIASQLQSDYTLRRKVRGAMVYPAIILLAMCLIGVLMLIYVVPTLVSTFKEMEIELPASTRFIIWLSESLTTNAAIIAAGILSVVVLIYWIMRHQFAKNFVDTVILKLPFFSGLVMKFNSARTTRTLSSLVSSGVEIMEALDTTSNVLQNHHYKKVLEDAKLQIQKGSRISAPFKKADNIFPSLVGEMIEVGEETGTLPSMLLRVATFYEEEVTEATKDMSTIIEPVLMIFIGGIVGFFAVAMMKPMYSMMSAF